MTRLGLFGLVLFLLVTHSRDARTESFGHIPDASVYLGRGFDPLYPQKVFPLCLESKGECQTGAKDSIACMVEKGMAIQNKFANTTTFSVRQIKTKYEFFKEVNITASLSGSYGPFSGAASFSSYAMDEINEDSLSWMVTAKSFYGGFSLIKPVLAGNNEKLSPGNLVGKCGASYVAEVDRGVIAAAVFTVYNLDEKHKREIRASLSAGFSTGVFDIAGSASFSEVVKQAMQYGSMSIRVYTMGGPGGPDLADLVKTNPTDLDNVKKILTAYVSNQDMQASAIVGFRTSGLGKLINKPSIDPDQSSYVYFYERANEYRLRLIDLLQRSEELLRRQKDFDQTDVDAAKAVHGRLVCELNYAELAMQSCRLSFDQTRRYLVDGVAGDDRPTELALTFGLAPSSSGLKVCSSAQTSSGASAASNSADVKPFVPFGWSRLAIAPGGQGPQTPPKDCKQKTPILEKQFGEMLQSASSSTTKPRTTGSGNQPATRQPCVAGCELERDDDLLASATLLPRFPFEVIYWFDTAKSSFSGNNSPGLYLSLRKAQEVRALRFYKGAEKESFGARHSSGAATVVVFIEMPNVPNDTIRVEVETANNNIYQIYLPQFNAL